MYIVTTEDGQDILGLFRSMDEIKKYWREDLKDHGITWDRFKKKHVFTRASYFYG